MASGDADHGDHRRRWAATELACYTIEGWDGARGWGSMSGLGLSGGDSITLSAGVLLTARDGTSIEVESHRQDDEQFWRLRLSAPTNIISGALRDAAAPWDPGRQAALDQEISRFQERARDDRLHWEGVVITIDGRPTIFCLTRAGAYWAAVGRGPDVDLTLASRGVAVPRALIRLPETPPPLRIRPPLPPRVRARRFPDDGLAPVVMADVDERTRVDLTYRDGHELSGTVAGTRVQLVVDVPAHEVTATGTFTDGELGATCHLGHNSETHPDVPGSLTGTYAGEPFSLNAVFHLDDDYVIDYATIAGDIAGQRVEGRLENADGGIGGTGETVYVEGSVGPREFSLFATIASGHRAMVRGRVAGEEIRLDANGVRGRSIRIAGSYQGPSALLAVIVVTVLHFV